MLKNMFGGGGGDERKFKKRREQLVEKLRSRGIENERVLMAIGEVPRHKFVETALENRAYKDTALPIEKGQTISQPYTVARQTELLKLQPGEKVLEIGTGSGYQAAILCEMGAEVYTVERHKRLYERARNILENLDYDVTLKCDDGSKGWSAYSPYDGILVTAAAPEVPETFKEQLALGGRLVIPIGGRGHQTMVRVTRTSEDEYQKENFSAFKFVPLIGREGWQE